MTKMSVKLVMALILVVSVTGCATKGFVRTELETADAKNSERIELIKGQIEDTQLQVAEQGEQLDEHGNKLSELSASTRDALDRAIAANKLAEGKLLYEKVLNTDKLRFASSASELSPEAKAELDVFSEELVLRNENVFIEIQGHTDSTGSEAYNLKLGEERAESVRRYLSNEHEIPLHRIAVISYGESAPLIDNKTRENRAMNRRVTLVVLK
jgi:outer membrane protein OmpA-like peptidoglycan-associated protein